MITLGTKPQEVKHTEQVEHTKQMIQQDMAGPEMTPAKTFEEQRFLVITDVIPEDRCKQLAKHMFDLRDAGKTEKDPQCPLSDSIYGDPEWDKMLEELAKPLGEMIGIDLLPTYTYSRIYYKGEELKIHKDRPSCEISATMTVDFSDYPIWPIHMGNAKNVILDRGDLCLYRGCELDHYRDKFKGDWQVQVFFHYVDANGPHKDMHKDGRNNLGERPANRKVQEGANNDQMYGELEEYAKTQLRTFSGIYHDMTVLSPKDHDLPGHLSITPDEHNSQIVLTPDDIQMLMDEVVNKQYATDAGVGSNMTGAQVAKQIRSCKVYGVLKDEKTIGVFNKIANAIQVVNKFYYDFELVGFHNNMQLLEYKFDPAAEQKDYYNWHMDVGPGESATRKLSIVIQLTDPSEYKGCDLIINNNGMEVIGSKEKGAINMFPSYLPHMVKPIEEGTRYCLVVWVHGRSRFR